MPINKSHIIASYLNPRNQPERSPIFPQPFRHFTTSIIFQNIYNMRNKPISGRGPVFYYQANMLIQADRRHNGALCALPAQE